MLKLPPSPVIELYRPWHLDAERHQLRQRVNSWARVVIITPVRPANTEHSPKAVSMLAHRLRRWPNIETAVGECPVFAEVIQTPGYILPSQVPARPRTAFNTLVGRFFFFFRNIFIQNIYTCWIFHFPAYIMQVYSTRDGYKPGVMIQTPKYSITSVPLTLNP